jgi:ketosteroid isomerase-like protein
MKNIFVFVLCFISIAVTAQSKDEAAMLKVLDDQNAAWNRGDIDGFMKGYWENDSLMFVGKSGVTYGWTNTLNNYKKGYPDTAAMGKLTFTNIKVQRLSKKYYFIVGKWYLKRSIGDVSGHYNLLMEKIDGRWVIIADHSS